MKKAQSKKSSLTVQNKKTGLAYSAPISTVFRQVKLTDKLKKRIEQTKVKNEFLRKFNLQLEITKLPFNFVIASELNRQKSMPKELDNLFNKTESAGKEVIKQIKNIKKAYLAIENFGAVLKHYGTNVTKILSNDTRKNIKTINQLKVSTDYFSANKIIEQEIHLVLISRLTSELIKMITKAKSKLPPIKAGRPSNKQKKWLERWLVETYISGTKKTPEIGWKSGAGRYCKIKDDYKGKYTGAFFRYIRAIKPVIEEILKIKLGKTNSLAEKCRKTYRKEYKNILKEK